MKSINIPISVETTVSSKNDSLMNPLLPKVDLTQPKPLRVCFPVLLDGDMVMSTEHLGPAYLVAVLRNAGVECKIIEVAIGEDLEKSVQDIVSWKPDIVGISLTTISVRQAIKFGSVLKKSLESDVFVLAGGPLATHKGASLLQLEGWEFLDGLVRGEGEIPILRFAEAFHTCSDYASVPNLVYREGLNIKENPMAGGIENLDWLPYPARDQFEFHNKKSAYIRVSSSRGCTAHCTFCNAPHTKNRVGPAVKGWRGASPTKVVDEIEHLYHHYKFNTFDFVDSTFEDPGGKHRAKQRIADIAEDILRRNLKIYYNVCMQAYNWTEADMPLLNLLWRSGLEKVLVGIESGSEQGLQRWQKKSTVEDNARIIKMLRESKIYVAFGFISYHPWSSFPEVRENNSFLYKQMGHNLRRYTTRLEIYPGAEVIGQLRAEGLLLPDYDERLNPFAYKYQDERVGALASALNGLYGKQYEEDCTITKEPAVFELETYDIVLHTFTSRLDRMYGNDPMASEILTKLNEQIYSVKNEIAEYNYALMSHYTDLAERDLLTREIVWENAEPLNTYYTEKLKQLRSLQLRASMNLHRAKFNIQVIQMAA